MKNPDKRRIILASNSPRRRQLLAEIVPQFETAPNRDIDEQYPASIELEEVAPYLSNIKAEAYKDLVDEESVLITADTVVIIDNKILGKPRTPDEALEMLKSLSGREHKVVTGVTLKTPDATDTFSCTTLVFFDKLSDEEIKAYIEEFKPFDKAGSYGIQEWIGCRGIKKIDGCFYNVMGLPLNMLYNHLISLSK